MQGPMSAGVESGCVAPGAGHRKQAAELISGKTIELNGPVKVGPMSTVVLWME